MRACESKETRLIQFTLYNTECMTWIQINRNALFAAYQYLIPKEYAVLAVIKK